MTTLKTSPREPGASAASPGWAPFKLEPSEHTVPGGRSAELARPTVDASWTRFWNFSGLQRAWDFSERNDRPGKLQWAYPLIDKDVSRLESVKVCVKAGFTMLVGMYQKMGRFDCFWCPNQKIEQAQRVMIHYPKLWKEWKAEERKKGHPILSVSATAIETMALPQNFLDALDAGKSHCSCFGGETMFEDEDDVADARGGSTEERVSGPSELSGAQEPNEKLNDRD